jgi:dihydrofolate reductase
VTEGHSTGLIVAMTRDLLIGRDGDLPWHYSEDLKHFKRSTLDQALIMGRRCYESIGRALPRRTNIVVSASQAGSAGADGLLRDGVHWFGNLPDAVAFAERSAPSSWFAGGAELYRAVLASLDEPAQAGRPGPPGCAPPERLEVTWVPALDLLRDDVLFPYQQTWIERHYECVDERPGETPGLRFVSYRLRSSA